MTRLAATLTPLLIVLSLLAPPAAYGVPGPSEPVGTWPLRPTPDVVAGFDPPASAWGAGHRGVDLGGSVGQPVRSALPGTVSFAGSVAGRPVVVVDHGDTRTTYEPVVAEVSPGSTVEAGQRVGSLVLPGSHCFPRACLHWGWLRGETYLDPLRLVGGGPVRLLPLAGLPQSTPALEAPYARWEPLVRVYRTLRTLW
jgi:murein DD-endopeptidase MepM/ murein hydrolase activator NlpD